MVSVKSLVKPRARAAIPRGRFYVEVIDLEVLALLEGIEIATSSYSLADWLRTQASPLMAESILDRFADQGGTSTPGGSWAPLQESTIRIKEALGAPYSDSPNIRTESMLSSMMFDHRVDEDLVMNGAVMAIPGNLSDPTLVQKLDTAAFGHVQGPGEMIPGAYTPPRPVNEIDAIEVAMLMVSLEVHIMNVIAMMLGSVLVSP